MRNKHKDTFSNYFNHIMQNLCINGCLSLFFYLKIAHHNENYFPENLPTFTAKISFSFQRTSQSVFFQGLIIII